MKSVTRSVIWLNVFSAWWNVIDQISKVIEIDYLIFINLVICNADKIFFLISNMNKSETSWSQFMVDISNRFNCKGFVSFTTEASQKKKIRRKVIFALMLTKCTQEMNYRNIFVERCRTLHKQLIIFCWNSASWTRQKKNI